MARLNGQNQNQNGPCTQKGLTPASNPGDPFPAQLEQALRNDGKPNAWTADELRALKKACWSVLKRNVEEISTYPGLEARTAKKVGAKLRRMYENE